MSHYHGPGGGVLPVQPASDKSAQQTLKIISNHEYQMEEFTEDQGSIYDKLYKNHIPTKE
jgi:hypothetical protein